MRVLFTHFPRGPERGTTMWSVPASGQGAREPVFEHPDAYPSGTSADGRVVYYHAAGENGRDIFSVALTDSDPQRRPLLTTPVNEQRATPSPDGRWLAYSTDASGRDETRVGDLTDLSRSVQVSTGGGVPIRWSADGSRLFFTNGGVIDEVPVDASGPALRSITRAFAIPADTRAQDVMPDGEHAVFIRGGLMYSDLVVLQDALTPTR